MVVIMSLYVMQGELRVAKENSRRMEDRMRGILKERTELVRTHANAWDITAVCLFMTL